ncbi:MAG: glycosyltransferase family 4 protein [Candidatus Baltobacteraceae bacterium]
MNLGIDAYNLIADRRGMGRVVRCALHGLQERGASPVLIGRTRADRATLQAQFGLPAITAGDVRNARFAAVWFPWNAVRFEPHAVCAVTVHDPFAFTFPHRNAVARWREQRPIARAVRRADRVFAVSHWTARELRRLFGIDGSRMTVVPNEPDAYWKPVAADGRTPYLLFLGGAEERKNATMLLRAFECASANGHAAQLVIAGALAKDAEQLAASLANVRREHPDDERLRELYSGALALLVPSLAEGFGLPVLEAMACGAPVLAADAAALPETAGGAAELVALTPDAWERAIVRIAADAQLRDDLRARGFKRVENATRGAAVTALLHLARGAR